MYGDEYGRGESCVARERELERERELRGARERELRRVGLVRRHSTPPIRGERERAPSCRPGKRELRRVAASRERESSVV
jgi:hypothetical protein